MEFEKSQQEQVKGTMELMGQVTPSSYTFPIDQLLKRIGWLQSELDETREAIKNNDLKEFIDGIEDMRTVLNGFYVDTGIEERVGEIAYQRVTSSNNSKACKTIKEAIDTVKHYRDNKGIEAAIKVMLPASPFAKMPNAGLEKWKLDFIRDYERQNVEGISIEIKYQLYNHRESNDVYFVVVDAKTDKYLKSINYFEVNLKDIVDYIKNKESINLYTPSMVVNLGEIATRVLTATTAFNNLYSKYSNRQPIAFYKTYEYYKTVVKLYPETEYAYKAEEDIDINYYHEEFLDALITLEQNIEGLLNYFNK